MRMVSPVLSVRIRSAAFWKIARDASGLARTGGGICCFQDEAFEVYSLEEGLPDDIVFKAVEDTRGNIWFGTNHGLVCLNPESKEVQVFGKKDGLSVSRFNYNSAVVVDGETILWETMLGWSHSIRSSSSETI